MSRIRIGVVGIGKLGQHHCQALSRIKEADFAGVFDFDQKARSDAAATFGVKPFGSLDELLEDVEAVSVVVPTTVHLKTCVAALERGIHVFVEKPIAGSAQEADEIIHMARDRNLKLQVGHIERFNPAVLALDGITLDPMFIESHRLAPFDPRGTDVAVVLDLMIHDIDIILSLVKSPVKHIEANGVAVVSKEADIANARIQFQNGCVANVTASRISQKKMRKMRLFQRDTYISIDFLLRITELFRLADLEAEEPAGGLAAILGKIEEGEQKRKVLYEKLTPPEGDALQMELESFLKAITTDSEPPVTGEDARHALAVATEITSIIKNQAGGYDVPVGG